MIELTQNANEQNIYRNITEAIPFPELMTDKEIASSFSLLAEEAERKILQLTEETNDIISLMETLQNEEDWRKIRAGLTILESHSGLLSPDQIRIVLNYLFAMLPHKNSTVRRMAARTAGFLIASCARTNPDIWEIFLHRLLFPGNHTSLTNRRRIGYAIREILNAIMEGLTRPDHKDDSLPAENAAPMDAITADEATNTARHPLTPAILATYSSYFKSTGWDNMTCLYLVTGIQDISCQLWSTQQLYYIFGFMRYFLRKDYEEIRIASLRLLSTWFGQGWKPREDVLFYLSDYYPQRSSVYCEKYLVWQIRQYLPEELPGFQPVSTKAPAPSTVSHQNKTDTQSGPAKRGAVTEAAAGDQEKETGQEPGITGAETEKGKDRPDHELKRLQPRDLISENLRSETPWIIKIMNLRIMKHYYSGKEDLFPYATHLLNILRLNTQAVVFITAGRHLVQAMHRLSHQHIYEIVQEILKSIELMDDSSNYYPEFLGNAFLHLDPQDQIELLPAFQELSEHSNKEVVNTITETAAVILQLMETSSAHRTAVQGQDLQTEMQFFTGILYKAMASYKDDVAREAFFLAGHRLFRYEAASHAQQEYMRHLAKKALTYMVAKPAFLAELYNSSSLCHIHKYLRQNMGTLPDEDKKKPIAFFSGSFDPFTRGHKAVARELSEMGFRVYIDAHDFSWFQNTQPYQIRRQIISMSVADLEHVYLFPEKYPISLGNTDDLGLLRKLFPGREIYIVVGNDVVETNSAYMEDPRPGSIHTFPHIVFYRNISQGHMDRTAIEQLIQNEVLYMNLPSYYDTMSSQDIQQKLEEGTDISGLVDSQVLNYIMDRNLYSGDPIYKKVARTKPIETILDLSDKDRTVTILDKRKELKECGKVIYHKIFLSDLYEECEDMDLTNLLRQKLSGRVVRITSISGRTSETEDMKMTVLAEMLSIVQEQSYSYVLMLDSPDHRDLLLAQGFLPLEGYEDSFILDLSNPLAVFFDAFSFIKEPYCNTAEVEQVLWQCRKKLQTALPKLYPGRLVLNLETEILNYKLIRLVMENNPITGKDDLEGDYIPEELLEIHLSHEKMCVPFGKILKGVRLPDTVTKDLYTEKLYNRRLEGFEIREFPNYPSLITQIRSIKSFQKPVILVDDIFHKGYRVSKIRTLLDEEKVDVSDIIVGVISGQGRDLAKINKHNVKAVYNIPNMRAWILESDIYPFVGGDGIQSRDEEAQTASLLPSVNTILPYQVPSFLEGASREAFFELSRVCLENSRDLYLALEKVYQETCHRALTLRRLSEVFAEPRYPESGASVSMDGDRLVSDLIAAEIDRLERYKHFAT